MEHLVQVAPADFWFRSAVSGLMKASGKLPRLTRGWKMAGIQTASLV